MTITLELTPQQEARLRARAARQGADVQAYALQRLDLLDTDRPDVAEGEPPTGVQLLAELQADGVIGAWSDRDDIGESADFAQRLRTEAESRYASAFPSRANLEWEGE